MQPLTERLKILTPNLAHDPHRPQFHFLPVANWMNDPNGLIHWNGEYHLFYQYNPNGPFHGTVHWGHACSRDLVHWTDLPIALAPTPGGPDKDGCWSGCVVNANGVPTLFYTGVHPQVVCMATSSDDLITWHKYGGNPVINAPPAALDGRTGGDFRDPYLWQEDGTWYMVIGSRLKDVGGAILLFRSTDLTRWEYIHPLFSGDQAQAEPFWTATMWECPSFFRLGDKHVLVVSFQDLDKRKLLYTAYYTGAYRSHTFYPERQGILEYGGYFYAPQVILDQHGRPIMFGWLWEGRSLEAQREAGWAGVMSLPRLLSLHTDGSLGVEPVPELRTLRGRHTHFAGIDLEPASANVLGGLQGDCLEIIAEFEPLDAAAFGIKLRCSPDGIDETAIVCDQANGRLGIHAPAANWSSLLDPDVPETHTAPKEAPLDLISRQTVTLHVFLDRSVIEVFANGRVCLSSRIYPSRTDSLGLDLFACEGQARLKSMDVWPVDSIWDDRS